MNKADLIRLWSLDLQWFNPDNSELAISQLLNKGWMIEIKDNIKPNSNVNMIPPLLGWKPILRDIVNAPVCDLDHEESVTEIIPTTKSNISLNSQKVVQGDDEGDKINHLISYVSNNSGLSKREVVRRSQRKRKALGPITLWMCVALLAREQGLDMLEITNIIDN
jgi:hypothetical protein|tara:strand:- start:276 stop:770 length:495 start_codon:yes stop_codon:yes gene_type:complete